MGTVTNFVEATRIVIGVCTRNRPNYLRQCLASILNLDIPESCAVTIVVVDNADEPLARGIVATFNCEHVLPPIRYLHEARQGISYARNAVLSAAEQYGAEWIVMIDDDQIVPPDWLTNMVIAQQASGADVVKSVVDYIYPAPLPRWAFPKRKRHVWKTNLESTATCGVMFRAILSSDGGWRLRFDEKLALTGGEDTDFFARARTCGARIVMTPDAVASEFMPASKLTFRAQFNRTFTDAAVNARRLRGQTDLMSAGARALPRVLGSFFAAVGHLAASPLCAMRGLRHGRRRLLVGAKRLAKATGILTGLSSLMLPQPYRRIHGE
jgi:succinoglycan biosynthesis protein ExoM